DVGEPTRTDALDQGEAGDGAGVASLGHGVVPPTETEMEMSSEMTSTDPSDTTADSLRVIGAGTPAPPSRSRVPLLDVSVARSSPSSRASSRWVPDTYGSSTTTRSGN